MKPIIKWLGGKTQLLNKIRERLPENFNTYYEPFLGGAAVLLDLKPGSAVVNDINPELINMYIQVKENIESVISELTALDQQHESKNEPKEYYYQVRKDFNQNLGSNTPKQAARLIYLNKHCFNGLYRVNSKGEFNVPFNGKLDGKSFNAEHLQEVSSQIKSVDFMSVDFEEAVINTSSGDFVFLDSPYMPLTPTSFIDYTKEGFNYEDHLRLANLFKKLTDKGVYCMLTNHDTDLVRKLYKDFKIEIVDVRRSINRKGDSRTGKEVIITNYASLTDKVIN